jgi:hypothetical protein
MRMIFTWTNPTRLIPLITFATMRSKFSLTALLISIIGCTMLLLSSCKKDSKDCPAFSENLVAYIPEESRMMFYNDSGDSLLFRTDIYDKTEQYTMTRNRLSVGGTGAKPYCTSSCSLGSSLLSSDANQIGYTIKVDNEADTCSLSLSISSALSTNDYFLRNAPFAPSGKVFGDTLQLSNSTPTLNPRFSRVTIVYGRGIISITDDVEDCVWSR